MLDTLYAQNGAQLCAQRHCHACLRLGLLDPVKVSHNITVYIDNLDNCLPPAL